MDQVFVFEVLHPRKGLPFYVRIRDNSHEQAGQRVQKMHAQSVVRFVKTEDTALSRRLWVQAES
jgi:hypothetical protein